MSRRSITRSTAGAEGSIWGTIASYANELAPVAGPLLAAIGQTAEAIDRAEQRNRCIEAAAEAADERPQKSLNTTGQDR